MGVYVVLVLAVVFIWYFLSQNTASNSYTKTDFEKALKDGDVITSRLSRTGRSNRKPDSIVKG